LKHVDDWSAFLGKRLTGVEIEPARARERSGQPLAAPSFLKQIEKRRRRTLTKQKPGPKPKDASAEGGKSGR